MDEGCWRERGRGGEREGEREMRERNLRGVGMVGGNR